MLNQITELFARLPSQAGLAAGGVAFVALTLWARALNTPKAPRAAKAKVKKAPPAPAAAAARQEPAPGGQAYLYDYFISYNGENASHALRVEEFLRRRGKKVCVQAYDSKKGEVITSFEKEKISQSKNFIVLYSKRYEHSNHTRRELDLFVSDRVHKDYGARKIIVFRCDEAEPSDPDLRGIHWGELAGKTSDKDLDLEIENTIDHQGVMSRSRLTAVFDEHTPSPSNCFGRDSELAAIASHFLIGDPGAGDAPIPPERRRVLVQAGPGFGKTTLAAYFARTHRAAFAGVWWIPSQDAKTLLEAVAAISTSQGDRHSSGEEGPSVKERAARNVSRVFADTTAPFLLVFDNVGARTEDAGEGQGAAPGTERLVVELAALLPNNVRVLMTARRAGWDEGAKLVAVGPLAPNVGAEFLRARAHLPKDIEGSLELANHLGGLPLALDHAGAYCLRTRSSFAAYGKDILARLGKTPHGVDYEATVQATTAKALEHARQICAKADAATRLADLLSYCSADRIPRALCLLALDDDDLLTDEAVGALQDVGLVSMAEDYDDEPALTIHRLVQRIIRAETDASARSSAVIAKLMPFLCSQLVKNKDDDVAARAARFRKYLPHLFQALPFLDAPDFRGSEAGDLLDDVAKLVVLSLEEQAGAEPDDAPAPEHLPRLLGCFYEIDPLAKPLAFLLKRLAGKPKAWAAFRDNCLKEGNYVLRFALASALSDAILEPDSGYSIKEAESLIRDARSLDHFELGGYTLKSYYSERVTEAPDSALLGLLAAHPCYPGRSILGDLMLNLAFQRASPSALLPEGDGANARFWTPLWDFIAYDVNAIRAAEVANRGEAPPANASADVRAELAYRGELAVWQGDLLAALPQASPLRSVVQDYFAIGADPERLTKCEEAFAALAGSEQLAAALKLFFGHPLWSVAEAAASVVASLHSTAVEAGDTPGAALYHGGISALLNKELPWRVRFGALEAAYQIRLDESPKMATFAAGVRAFYDDPNSKIRGLCAENLVSILLNANNRRRTELQRECEKELRQWVGDHDCWVLEHMHRYLHTLAYRDAAHALPPDVAALVEHASPLCEGLSTWWLAPRHEFLSHLEVQKQRATGR